MGPRKNLVSILPHLNMASSPINPEPYLFLLAFLVFDGGGGTCPEPEASRNVLGKRRGGLRMSEADISLWPRPRKPSCGASGHGLCYPAFRSLIKNNHPLISPIVLCIRTKNGLFQARPGATDREIPIPDRSFSAPENSGPKPAPYRSKACNVFGDSAGQTDHKWETGTEASLNPVWTRISPGHDPHDLRDPRG